MKGWACVARMGGIGDNLVAASVLRPLKRLGYMTEVLTSDMAGAIFRNNPFLDKLTIKPDGEVPAAGSDDWRKWFTNRSAEYDVFVHLSYSMEVRHALFPNSTAFWWPEEYRREICAGNYLETVHKIAGLTPPFQTGPIFFPTDEEKYRAEKLKKERFGDRYVAWIISGSRIDKVYPYSSFAISRIISELNIPVVLFGSGAKQFEQAKQIVESVGRHNSVKKLPSSVGEDGVHWADDIYLCMTNDADKRGGTGGEYDWPIRRSLTQVLASDIMVSPDTGAAWAGAFEQIPKIIMLSHASAENITKGWINTISLHADQDRVPCYPCHRLHNDPSTCHKARDRDVSAAACMADISVDMIVESVRTHLQKDNVVRLRATG